MTIPEITKQIIKENKQYIIDKNYQELFNNLNSQERKLITQMLWVSNIDFLSHMNKIMPNMFEHVDWLDKLDIPDNISKIVGSAFATSSIKEVSLPKYLKHEKLGAYIFERCVQLSKVTFKDNSLTAIPVGMFANCSSLKNIDLPNKLQFIGTSAFMDTDIREIVLPETLISIGAYAFNPDVLDKIHFMGSENQWNNISKPGNAGIQNAAITFER